ncbi:MAG TPA: hypothetical protein VGK54_13905, partial [Chloroflexota bacterium]
MFLRVAGPLLTVLFLAFPGLAGEPKGPLAAATRSPVSPIPRRGEVCLGGNDHSLPLPSTLPAAQFVDFEKQVLGFLQRGDYQRLKWCVDKGVRDTGPFLQGVYYGNHPAVRIYYSPKIMQWLLGRRQGTIPDGAMIVKEQYSPPAARYAGLTDDQLPKVT